MSLHTGDKRAGFVGLIATAGLLFLMSFTIVKLTNAKYAGHGAEEKAGQRK